MDFRKAFKISQETTFKILNHSSLIVSIARINYFPVPT